MASVAVLGVACGNCCVGVLQQWWYTKRYGADGMPGTERKATFLHVDCGFSDAEDADVESIYGHMAAASEDAWEAYLRGQPLPRKPMVVASRTGRGQDIDSENEKTAAGEPAAAAARRPPMESWPTDVRPALALITRLHDTVDARVLAPVRKGAELAVQQMDVARKLRAEDEGGPESAAAASPSAGTGAEQEREQEREAVVGAEGKQAVRRDVTVPVAPADEQEEGKDGPRTSSSSGSPKLPRTPKTPASARPTRAPAPWTIDPAVIPPRPAEAEEGTAAAAVQAPSHDARLSGETATEPLPASEADHTSASPTAHTLAGGAPATIEIDDPLLPPSSKVGSGPTSAEEAPAPLSPTEPRRPPTPTLPLGLPLPAFLKPAMRSLAAPLPQVSQVAGRLRPALGVLNQARGARVGSEDSLEREMEQGVYLRLAEGRTGGG